MSPASALTSGLLSPASRPSTRVGPYVTGLPFSSPLLDNGLANNPSHPSIGGAPLVGGSSLSSPPAPPPKTGLSNNFNRPSIATAPSATKSSFPSVQNREINGQSQPANTATPSATGPFFPLMPNGGATRSLGRPSASRTPLVTVTESPISSPLLLDNGSANNTSYPSIGDAPLASQRAIASIPSDIDLDSFQFMPSSGLTDSLDHSSNSGAPLAAESLPASSFIRTNGPANSLNHPFTSGAPLVTNMPPSSSFSSNSGAVNILSQPSTGGAPLVSESPFSSSFIPSTGPVNHLSQPSVTIIPATRPSFSYMPTRGVTNNSGQPFTSATPLVTQFPPSPPLVPTTRLVNGLHPSQPSAPFAPSATERSFPFMSSGGMVNSFSRLSINSPTPPLTTSSVSSPFMSSSVGHSRTASSASFPFTPNDGSILFGPDSARQRQPNSIPEEGFESQFTNYWVDRKSIPLSNDEIWTLARNSQLDDNATLLAINELGNMVGPEGHAALYMVLGKKTCNILNTKKLLEKLQSLGHFQSALIVLQYNGGNLRYVVETLTRFRALGTEDDYWHAIGLLQSSSYNVLSTQHGLDGLKGTASTGVDFTNMLRFLSSSDYRLEETRGILDSLRTKWTQQPGDYSCLLGLLDYHDYDVDRTTLCLSRLSVSKKAPKEVQSLRYSVSLHLLAYNEFELDQTVTEIEYLCASYFTGAPLISLKTLKGADYDLNATKDAFSWLNQAFNDDTSRIRVLEENEFRVKFIMSSLEVLYSILYDKEDNTSIRRAFRANDYNIRRLLRQHEWVQELTYLASEVEAILRMFVQRGWGVPRLQRLLGATPSEQLGVLGLIGKHHDEDIYRCLDKMNMALEGYRDRVHKLADSLFRKMSFDLDVASYLQRMRDIVLDEWGMMLILSFIHKDENHELNVAVQSYTSLRNFIHRQDRVFLEFLLTFFQQDPTLTSQEFASHLVAIRNKIIIHHHAGVIEDVSTAFEHVLYAVCTSKLELQSTIELLNSPYTLKDYIENGLRACTLNSTVQAVRKQTEERQRVSSVWSAKRPTNRLKKTAQLRVEAAKEAKAGVLWPVTESDL
ncbi:hypothetical protein FRC17_004944 [Serendipita sp. 399]|nr:hypothetical protein FRC17_004944 [Serendipita sp. 399]